MNDSEILELKKEQKPLRVALELLSKENYGLLMKSYGQRKLLFPLAVAVQIALVSLYVGTYAVQSYVYVITGKNMEKHLQLFMILYFIALSAGFFLFIYLEFFYYGKLWYRFSKWYDTSNNLEELEGIFKKR